MLSQTSNWSKIAGQNFSSTYTTETQNDLALELDRLTCAYGKKVVVNNLSLHVPIGSVYGFLGPNGAGKTTTIKTLVGMRPLQSGRATLLGMDVATQGLEIRQYVGYMAETNNLYGHMKVSEMVEVARRMSHRWNSQSVNHYLDLFQLPHKEKIRKLSKGMKGQLALTLVLGSEPDLLILDEPTSDLDPLKRYEFLNQIVREVSSAGRTIFFSSHNLSEVEQIADRVAIVNEGRLIVEDDLDSLKSREKAVKTAFDRPVWTHDLEAIPGVRRVLQEGRRFRLLVRGEAEQVVAELHNLGASSVEIVDMNLEAIFVAYLQDCQQGRLHESLPE
ncbi:MAG: ABC transporter ATP-binding protein [Chloroflexota bacterium]|nr:ABC transporter ATP-binding protein [Chloroflexota bacterium]